MVLCRILCGGSGHFVRTGHQHVVDEAETRQRERDFLADLQGVYKGVLDLVKEFNVELRR